MIRLVIGFITFILFVLMGYMYISTKQNTTTKASNKVTQAKEPTIDESSQETALNLVKSHKTIDQYPLATNIINKTKEKYEIGKGYTVENINNADVSSEEKEIMLSDMLYYKSKHTHNHQSLTPSDIEAIITKDIEEGLIP